MCWRNDNLAPGVAIAWGFPNLCRNGTRTSAPFDGATDNLAARKRAVFHFLKKAIRPEIRRINPIIPMKFEEIKKIKSGLEKNIEGLILR